MGYKFLDHPADVIVHLEGRDPEELLAAAAAALADLLVGTTKISLSYDKELCFKGEYLDTEELIVSFLNDLIYEASVNKIVLPKIEEIVLKENSYSITVKGSKVGEKTSSWKSDVKAATFGGLEVRRCSNGSLQANVILDQ